MTEGGFVRLFAVAVCFMLFAAPPSLAVKRFQNGTVVSFDGGISPEKLPRERLAPVAVHVAGGVESASGRSGEIPQLRRIKVAINRAGQLFDKGVPVCRVGRIQPATEAAAIRICGDSVVGRGRVKVEARIPDQAPFSIGGPLLAFNGPLRHGHRLILAQVYADSPPSAIILVFEVTHHSGTFGTVLTTRLPKRARSWAYLSAFSMTLHRTFTYRGVRRSYVSAACGAPAGFRSVVFPFARVTYAFADGSQTSISNTGICRVEE